MYIVRDSKGKIYGAFADFSSAEDAISKIVDKKLKSELKTNEEFRLKVFENSSKEEQINLLIENPHFEIPSGYFLLKNEYITDFDIIEGEIEYEGV